MDSTRHWLLAAALLIPITLTGCSGFTSADNDAPCLDDSQGCIDARSTAFNAMKSDGERKWIGKPVNARLHASGVRMFAYRAEKDKLSCAELTAGMNEMSAVRSSLSGAVPGASKDRVVQAKMLADETHAELQKVHARKKCA